MKEHIFKEGECLLNQNGTYYTVTNVIDKNEIEMLGADGWACTAMNPYINENGKLEWSHSVNGRFVRDPLVKRLFVDMDGTLAVFNKVDKIEQLYEEGYFKNLEPNMNVVNAVKEIIERHPEIEVKILSAHLSDSKYALAEKNEWLDKYLPEIKREDRIFPPCGEDKGKYIEGGYGENDYLLDDYTHNLKLWCPPGQGVKLLNGINHTRGSWQGKCVDFNKDKTEMAKDIVNIILPKENIRKEKKPKCR